MPSVPRLFPSSTIVCLASGPSLAREDVDLCRGRVPVIAVNDTYQWAPWADVLYACDARWWHANQGAQTFAGRKYGLETAAGKWPGVEILKRTGDEGLESHPSGLRTGKNSGYQAINLAWHLGAVRVLLLGYDMQGDDSRSHFLGHHRASPYAYFRVLFQSLASAAEAVGLTVINCSRKTALTCFPRMPLADALALQVAA